MTDREIVKALEFCGKLHIENIDSFCNECIFKGKAMCIGYLCDNSIDLINRLQAENETLRDVVKQNHLIRNNGKSPLSLIKAEAYEEFIDKFLEKAISTRNYFEIKSLARIVLNELVGDGGCDTCKSLTCDGCELYEELVGEDK